MDGPEAAKGAHRAARCILHVGPPKTGTTSIQRSLFGAADALAAAGYHYPTFMFNHGFFVSWFGADPEQLGFHRRVRRDAEAIAAFNRESRAHFEAEFAQIKPHTLVLSSEFLSQRIGDGVAPFLAYLSRFAENVEVWLYVRRPSLLSESRVSHRVRRGDARLDVEPDLVSGAPYRDMVEIWEKPLGRAAIRVRLFPGDPPIRGDVVADFLEATGIAESGVEVPIVRANPALSGAALLLADALNKSRPRFDKNRMGNGVLNPVKGPRLRLGADFWSRIDEINHDEIAYLADVWGITFPEPDATAKRSRVEEVFTPEAVESIALLINDLSLRLQAANTELRDLRKAARQDPNRQKPTRQGKPTPSGQG